MQNSYVSIDRIFSKLIRDATDQFNEGDVIEWCGEALEFIQAVRSYEEAVAFIEVRNHQCALPSGLHAIIQVARNHCWKGTADDTLCPQLLISEATKNPLDTPSASIPVALDCNGEPINAFDLAYYRPFFDLKFEHDLWCGHPRYTKCFAPVRLATSTFFNNLVCREVNHDRIYRSSIDEYTPIQKKFLRFSFKEGIVAVSYLRQIVDEETGYPMIPDNISYTTAITKYILMMMAQKEFFNNREGSGSKLQKFEVDWQWYCKQASNSDMMPNGIDEHQNLLDQRSYILPARNNYYNFFGSMARPEVRNYNDPDHRNMMRTFAFRGLW